MVSPNLLRILCPRLDPNRSQLHQAGGPLDFEGKSYKNRREEYCVHYLFTILILKKKIPLALEIIRCKSDYP